ncbi:MAG TPA: hypothetical protein VN329_16985, partial [Roseomonas sp.]|nr:hypothetical protein [Roseomonas sp.]
VAEGSLRAPLSGRRCAWFEAWVEELRAPPLNPRDRVGETGPRWERIFLDSSDQPIRVSDGRATCLVAPEGARIHETAWSAWEGDTEQPPRGAPEPELQPGSYTPSTLRVAVTVRSVFGDSPVRYRYVERYIMAGDPIFAMGEAEPRRGRRRARATTPEADGDAPAEARLRIRKPDTRQPFVISTQDPAEVHAENQLASTGGLILAGMGLVAGFVLWKLRYG